MKIELNNIYNMDCLDGMKLMQEQGIKVDCILTSPPYNTARNSQNLQNHEGRYDIYTELHNNQEYIDWTLAVFDMYDQVLNKNGKILYNMSYGTENTSLMSLTVAEIIKNTNFTLADIIVWEKNSALPNNVSPNKLTRICEFVYVFCRKSEFNTFICNKKQSSTRDSGQVMYENIPNKIFARNNDESCPYNKATFSTELCMKLMKIYCKEDEIVLDTFMGSGTTALSCVKTNRTYIGFELSANQCEWAKNRIEKETNQISIFDI